MAIHGRSDPTTRAHSRSGFRHTTFDGRRRVLFHAVFLRAYIPPPTVPDSRMRIRGTALLPIKRGARESRKGRSRRTVVRPPSRSHDTKHTFEISHVADVVVANGRPDDVVRSPP